MEAVFFIGAFISLTALICGSFSHRCATEPLNAPARKSCGIDIVTIKPGSVFER